MKPLKHARIDWKKEVSSSTGETIFYPYNLNHQDVYFSKKDGKKETENVYLSLNNLPERFQFSSRFSIGEIGFGLGLNFYSTLEAWKKNRSSLRAYLDYISFENTPASSDDLNKLGEIYPEFIPEIKTLLNQYPKAFSGIYSIYYKELNAKLTLVLGDALEEIKKILSPVGIDAWFLDGFNPKNNSSAWDKDLIKEIANLSHSKTTLSSFSVAREVKDALLDAGFEIEKKMGSGFKRDVLFAKLKKTDSPSNSLEPWFTFKQPRHDEKLNNFPAIIIGAGIAGVTLANSLAKRKIKSLIIDANETIGTGASGNPQAISMPFLAKHADPKYTYTLYSFLELLRISKNHFGKDLKEGVLELIESQEQKQKIKSALESEIIPSDLCSLIEAEELKKTLPKIDSKQFPFGVLYFPYALTFNPRQLIDSLLENCSNYVTLKSSTQIKSISQDQDLFWTVSTQDKKFTAKSPVVVFCNSYDVVDFFDLPITKVRGQLYYLKKQDFLSQSPFTYNGKYYFTSASDQTHVLGASHDRRNFNLDVNQSQNIEFFDYFKKYFPTLKLSDPKQGRVSFRSYSQDTMPIVGPIADFESFRELYKDIKKGYPPEHYPEAKLREGLFVNVGHGSRGFSSSFLSAELITSLILQETLPVDKVTLKHLHPSRCAIRKLIKNET